MDSIPFSKNKKNIHRDFSDGVMMAELLNYFFPGKVDLHNYSPTNSIANKTTNWEILNEKVFKKVGIVLKKKDIEGIVGCKSNSIEKVLKELFVRVGQPIGGENLYERGRESFGETGSFVGGGGVGGGKERERERDEETEQTQELQEKIEHTYIQLMKLNEISRLKDSEISSLERKLDDMLFYK